MTSETSAVLVAVRVRPFQPNEDAATCAVSVPNDKTINITDVWPVLLANTVNVPSHSYTSPLNKHNNTSSSNYVNDVSHNISGTETSLHNLSNYPITPTTDNNMNSLDNSMYSSAPLTRKDDPYSSANTSQFTNADTLSCMSASVLNTLNNSNYSTCNSVVNYNSGMSNSNNSTLASAQHSFSFDKVFWSVQTKLLPLSLVAEPFHQLCLPEHNPATTTTTITTSSTVVGFGGGALGSANVNSGNSNNNFYVANDDLPSMSILSRRTSVKSGIITSVHGANSVNDKIENVTSSLHTCMNNNNNTITIKLPAQLPCFCATPAFDSQRHVYDFIGPKMYDAAFSGFNTCLFAYGQTGSGKTYSMIGPPEKLLPGYGKNNNRRASIFGRFQNKESILMSSSPKGNKNDSTITTDSANNINNDDDDDDNVDVDDDDDAGIMPRLCSDLFDIMRKERETDPGVSFTVEMSFMEIYCEKVRDLLAPNLSSASNNPSLRIRQHPVRGPYVEGLSRYSVKSATAVLKHLLRGLKERATAETKMNEHSSRSHAIMQLFITKVTVTTVATMSTDSNSSNAEAAETKNTKRFNTQKLSKNDAKKRVKKQINKESSFSYSTSSVGSPRAQKSEQQLKKDEVNENKDVDNVFHERMNADNSYSNSNNININSNIHCDDNNLISTSNNSSATVSSKVSRKEEYLEEEQQSVYDEEEQNEDEEDEEGEQIADRLNEGEVVTKTRRSKVSMVDLAGSERVSQSGVTGERFEETKNINLSLSSLGRIIQQLSEKQSGKHVIPAYRESNLTWLLSDSLGGNSKTIMLATVAPNAYCYQQTLNTLRFAGVTKKIINVATVNEDSHFQQLIADLRQQIVRLTLQIENSKHVSMHEAEVIQLSAECELLRQQNGALRVQLSTMPDSSTVLTLQERIAALHHENASLRDDIASLEHELLTSNSTHRAELACKDAELTRLREQQSHIITDHNARSATTCVLPDDIVNTATTISVKNASTTSDKNNTKMQREKGNENINVQVDNTNNNNTNNESIESTNTNNNVMVTTPFNVTTNANKATEMTGQGTSAASMIAAHANQNIHEFTLVHSLRSQIQQLTREMRGYKRRFDEANEVINNQERELKEVKLRQRKMDEQYNIINTSLRVKVIELERRESELAILREEHAAMQRQHEVELEWYESRITLKNSKDNDKIAEQMHQVRDELERVQQAYWNEKHSSADLLLRVTELEKEKQEMRIDAHNKQHEINTLERYLFEETEMSERYYQQMRYERQLTSMLHETQRHLQYLHHEGINNEIPNAHSTKLEQVCKNSQSDCHRYKQSKACIINNINNNNNNGSTRFSHNTHALPSVSSSMSLSSISMSESLTTLSPITSNHPTSIQGTFHQEQITNNYHDDSHDNHTVDTGIINSPNRNDVDAIKLQSTLMREDVLFRTLGITYAQLEYECVSEEIRHRLMIEQECQHSIEQLQTTQLQGYKVIAMNLTIACNDAHDMINSLNDKLHRLKEQLRESEMALSESQKLHTHEWELHSTKSEVERARMQRELQHLFEERIANKQREINLLTMELEEWEDRYKELQVRCQHAETRILELEEESLFSTHTTQSTDELANKQDANTTAAFLRTREKTPTPTPTKTETETKYVENENAEVRYNLLHQNSVVDDAKPVDEEDAITTTQEKHDHLVHKRHVSEAHVQELRDAYAERDVMQAECNALQSEIIALRSKVEEQHSKLIEVESELDAERGNKALHVQTLQSRLDILQQKYDKAIEASERQMNELLELVKVQRVSLKEESKETDAARSDRDKALRELYQVREQLEKAIDECNQLKEQNGEHSRQLTTVRNEISSLKLSYKQLENELHRLTNERGPDMYLLVDRTGTSEEDELRERECFTKAREERVKLEEQRRMAHKLNEELKRHILRQTSQLRDVERLLEDKHEEEEEYEEHKGVNLVNDRKIDLPVK